MAAAERVWIVRAPVGMWSTGPIVCHFEDTAQAYREDGWEVAGPYVLEHPQVPPAPEVVHTCNCLHCMIDRAVDSADVHPGCTCDACTLARKHRDKQP